MTDKEFVLEIYPSAYCELVKHPYFSDSFVIFFKKLVKPHRLIRSDGKEEAFRLIKLGISYRSEKYAWFKARQRCNEIMIETLLE